MTRASDQRGDGKRARKWPKFSVRGLLVFVGLAAGVTAAVTEAFGADAAALARALLVTGTLLVLPPWILVWCSSA